ncbi:MAG: LptF/LptG family permease [Sedimentisphaerales bacterium]|nr:LptF/LptG family permease [Sedimentisphaerales bacterium]
MVFTLQRYVFRELFRIFLLATIGLTLILSLGGTLRPAQEYGVGPRQIVHILLYFMPISLTFVLPMSALFASALAYGRFASDNELDACRASGISMATLVYPGLVLAILVAIANLMLSFHVMPYFVRLAEKSLKADAKQILFRNIQRKGFYSLPPDERWVIYADYADVTNDTLFGIVVVESSQETIKRIVTSEMAQVHFNPHERFNEVQLTAYNAKWMGAADDLWGQVKLTSFKPEFGSLLGDEIKFKKIGEMKRIAANPMLFDPISRMARTTYAQLVTERLAQDISKRLSQDGSYEIGGASRFVRLSATGCALKEEFAVDLVAPVVVEEYDADTGQSLRRLQCDKAVIHVGEDVEHPELSLDVSNARVEETGLLVVREIIRDLALPEPIARALGERSVLEVVVSENVPSVLDAAPSTTLARRQKALDRELRTTLIDIKAEINSRLVFGIGCVPMILIGIGLGIVKRGGHMLSAFGASCVPAAVLIVTIISGKHVTENVGAQAVSGILVMWAGLAFLIVLAAFIYGKLLRH